MIKRLFYRGGLMALPFLATCGKEKEFTPEIVSHVDLDGVAGVYGAAATGNYGYAASGPNGVYVIDISDVQAPTLTDSLSGMDARNLFVDGSRLYVAGADSGLLIYDISDPAHPSLLGRYTGNPDSLGVDLIRVNDVFAVGSRAYVVGKDLSADSGVVQVLDVSDPTTPFMLREFSDTGEVHISVWVDGNYVSTGTEAGRLYLLDTLLVLQYVHPTTGISGPPSMRGISIAGEIAYLADGAGGFIAMNLADGSELGVFNDPTGGPDFWGVVLDGSTAYTANGSGGILAVDISDPADMSLLFELESSGALYTDVALRGDYILATDNGNEKGLDIIRVK
ncbi:MAG: hypothetical protein ABIM19_08585 [candidate division WOR-3 bacterium]